MNIYPAFGLLQDRNVSALLNTRDLSQPTFGHSTIASRDINVYIPPSILQNTIKRPIHILVANDGSLQEVKTYISSGFDVAVQNGIAPESILVGIPQTGDSCNRNYELSFSNCKPYWAKYNRGTSPATYSNYYGCPGSDLECEYFGGNDDYLTWIYEVILPAVVEKLGMTMGEVSIVGGSMGGLTACYAASKYPDRFTRGYCYAPAMMWNFGELAHVIKHNYYHAVMKKLPKAVVFEIGHEAYDVFLNKSNSITKNLLQLGDDVLKAWQSVGMQSLELTTNMISSSQNKYDSYDSTVAGSVPPHMVIYYNSRGTFHAPQMWQTSFMLHLHAFYRPGFNSTDRMQCVDYQYYIGQQSNSDGNNDDDSVTSAYRDATIAVSVVAGLSIVLIISIVLFILTRMKKSPPLLLSGSSSLTNSSSAL